MLQFFVGIDWGSEFHQVCVLGADGQRIEESRLPHSEAGIWQLIGWLERLGGGNLGVVGVGIELPRGAVVEALVERGAEVYSINPKQLDRFRDRYSMSGAKDDRRDAFVLADALRTDRECFRRVQLDDPWVIQLREASRLDKELGCQETQLANRLAGQLHRFWPSLLQLCPAGNEPWLWALLRLAPTPQKAKALRHGRLAELLRRHHIRRLDAEQLLQALQIPPLQVAEGTIEAATLHIGYLLDQLELIHRQRNTCRKTLEKLLDEASTPDAGKPREHRDGEILRSMPGVGIRVAATVLAEAPRAVAHRDYQTVRALAGVAPITRSSGKSRQVTMRYACNQRLRDAVYHWAANAIKHDPHSRARYDALRQRGHSHPRALRTVADANLRSLMAMLKTRSLYIPQPLHQEAA